MRRQRHEHERRPARPDDAPSTSLDATSDGRAGAPTRPRDRGTTLVELLVTIVIMGTVMAPVMNAVVASITASATNRGLAQVETALHNAADKVNRARKGCDYTVFASAAAQAQGWSSSAATVQQFHYVPAATPATPGTWANGACPATGLRDLLVQLVTVTVTNPDTGAQRTIQVVKSDV